ncbi:hypothetical protein [Aliikangiella sp. G2MR2-5]|uniref:hypothetical protein n=1 Tax=Aliikangiella sp. G2MR2-5 TaxID=2788943 RepID=UPI0018AC590C|nr:hypothetical protein [Aliikangiella sp. G2MR2-5]
MKTLLLIFSIIVSMNVHSAEEDEWSDSWSEEEWGETSPWFWSNKVDYSYGGLLKSSAANINDSTLDEFRWRSKLDYAGSSFKLETEIEGLSDKFNKEELKITRFSLYKRLGKNWEAKVGRQVITWGTADLLFLNDLMAKDWRSFFNGREDYQLKPEVDAIRLSYYGLVNFEIAYLPEFAPDITPNGERYSFYIPGSGIIQPQPEIVSLVPDEPELSARVFTTSGGIEWSLYYYQGFFKSPTKYTVKGFGYAEMDSLGASLRLPAFGGLFNAEISYYNSKEDPDGTNALIPNDQLRFLVGYETEIANDISLATQFYLEKTGDYQSLLSNAPSSQVLPEENRTVVTMRLTHLALQQRLVNSLMFFYSPSDEDHYLRYSSTYKISDSWRTAFGVNLLKGKRDETFLAQMKDNSNLFFRVHYSF